MDPSGEDADPSVPGLLLSTLNPFNKVVLDWLDGTLRGPPAYMFIYLYTGWGSEQTQMRVQEDHQTGKWRENEEIVIEARAPTVHLDMKHKRRRIEATMAADATLAQLEAQARQGFGIKEEQRVRIRCWAKERTTHMWMEIEPMPLKDAVYEIEIEVETVDAAIRVEQREVQRVPIPRTAGRAEMLEYIRGLWNMGQDTQLTLVARGPDAETGWQIREDWEYIVYRAEQGSKTVMVKGIGRGGQVKDIRADTTWTAHRMGAEVAAAVEESLNTDDELRARDIE
jgi:hypothetical protein